MSGDARNRVDQVDRTSFWTGSPAVESDEESTAGLLRRRAGGRAWVPSSTRPGTGRDRAFGCAPNCGCVWPRESLESTEVGSPREPTRHRRAICLTVARLQNDHDGAGVAQLVEQRTRNAQVLGSIPSASSNEVKWLPRRALPPRMPILHFSYTLDLAPTNVRAIVLPDNLHVRIWRGPRLGNWAGVLCQSKSD